MSTSIETNLEHLTLPNDDSEASVQGQRIKKDKGDRYAWGEGPWDEEPDLVRFHDITGLQCVIRRSAVLGGLCGYVRIPPGHPCQEEETYISLNVHGGITFSKNLNPATFKQDTHFWIGFDCSHSDDFVPGMSKYYAGTISLRSRMTYRTIEYVKRELFNLCDQIHAQPTILLTS